MTKLAVRDSRDPFTQALAFVFKEEKNAAGLKEKLMRIMVPLITQVAVKIGAIDTERSVANRALPVFTGTISIYLACQTKGQSNVPKWAEEIVLTDLQTLFRKGYTMLDKLIRHSSPRGRDGKMHATLTFTERLEEYATCRQDDAWAGYALYEHDAYSHQGETTKEKFSRWLVRKAKATVRLNDLRAPGVIPKDVYIADTVISRILFNVLHTGRISFGMDFRRIREIVDAARKNEKWFERAELHYDVFLKRLPDEFRQVLAMESETSKTVGYVLLKAKEMADKKNSRDADIDNVSLIAGVLPIGLSKDMQKFLKEDEAGRL